MIIGKKSKWFILLAIIAMLSVNAGFSYGSATDDQSKQTSRSIGVIKWYKNQKGYGFITPIQSEHTADTFVHSSGFRSDIPSVLRPNTKVSYMPFKSPKGWIAIEVEVIED